MDSIKNNSLVSLSAPDNYYYLNLEFSPDAKRDISLGLELRMEGDSLKVRTVDSFKKRIQLRPGESISFGDGDIRHYFNPDSLIFEGKISQDAYLKNNTLPEGHYTICFRVFDWEKRPDVLDD